MTVTNVLGRSLIVLAALGLATADGAAQAAAQSFAALAPTLKSGQRVVVTLNDVPDARGRLREVEPIPGQVVSVTDKELVIKVDGLPSPRRFAEDEVRRIHKPDSNWPSALIGGGIGLALAIPYVNKPRPDLGDEAAGKDVALPVLGFIIGWVIDASIERTLYVSSRKATASFVPTLGPGRVGIVATIRFR